ncbi:MAG: protein kinase [Anaerolineae bacterium]|nr:protein kinase [Anaerolineae bacterium]
MPLPEDTILENRYRIDGLLAHGGMGAIYRAFDTNLSTPVAIKENFFQTPQAINQFKREALILARLRHPALPRVTHHFSFEGQQYLVMDFIEGENLWQIVKKQGHPLEEAQAINYIQQVGEAVNYLHRQTPPIIHRDIKPQNIKITPDGRAVLVDFGIAKEGAAGSRTQTGAQGVTPGFSPPEQYSGLGTTPASDIYSLGATLYAVLTGKKPPDSVSLMVGGSKFQPPDEVNARLSHHVSEAIVHAMQVKPADRPESVAAWQKELETIAGSYTLTGITTPAQDKEDTMVGATVAPPMPPGPLPPPPLAPPTPSPTSPPPGVISTPPRQKSAWFVLIPIVVAVFILLGAVVAAGYILYSSGVLTFSNATPAPSPLPAEGQPEETVAAIAQLTTQAETEQQTAQAELDTQNTRQAQQEATAVVEAGLTETAMAAENIAVDTPTSTPTLTPTPQPAPATPTTETTPTSTSTPTNIAATEPTPTRKVVSGPTLVPLKSEQSVAQIGVREVIDVDINLQNPQEVYALVKADGIYKSTNGGDGPWTRMELDGSGLTAFVIDPHNPATFYAPSWNAVLKSTDGGNNWQAYGSGLSTANRVVDVVTVDPANPNLLYGGIGATLVVSTDGGQTWVSDGYGRGLVGGRLTHIVIDLFNHDTVYVGGFFGSIYKSVDSGRNFIPLAYGVGEGVFGMAAHPTQKDVYLVGINSYDAGIIKTENGGDFTSVSNGLIFGGADSAYSAITYAPSNPSIVYTGSGYEEDRFAKGIFKSADGGKSWEDINNGLSVNGATGFPHYVKSMAVHPTNPNIVLAATGGGLYKSVDGGGSWSLK